MLRKACTYVPRVGTGLVNSRFYSNATTIKSYFDLFPQTFPDHGPPNESFMINPRRLRREYRTLQSEHHPDIVIGSAALSKSGDNGVDDKFSSLLNKAYSTISNPYSRIAHLIEVNHPDHLDITQDDISKRLISDFQSSSDERSMEYKNMLMMVLEAHESLELATQDQDLEALSEENDERIVESEEAIGKLLETKPLNWNGIMMEAVRLKYWINIQKGIKDWEPGKPVNITH
ncbi:DEHA2A06974p [Debaryomyces hansenii CBS767]|uniref:DEHA2A06974p n=1 Tax=Debaryomyces hansenii (strain ATCC 36239 / CBS 767 / BCRC 21394 / JCM 1990 / NBRC 0083 / IGC 2968) TaxID=284592 RepID=Q6BYU1_DEBHA|nr:DEHA2A06974p [Debaryomyces hansenii CBS767]CAG84584.2 DEHA2A06974p [Debaryomyces hansenii CBS767]|eukprot:XP_456628.2 DEHA2A06974p [Debaryomyces hansenii CBS767]